MNEDDERHWKSGEKDDRGLKRWIRENPTTFVLIAAGFLVAWTYWGDELIDYIHEKY